MATKITLVGAGSTVFAQNLLGDILSESALADAHVSLHDIDDRRLETSRVVAEKTARAVDASPTIEATTDRRRALDGADHVITMFQVGGYEPSTVMTVRIGRASGSTWPSL